MAQPIRRTTSHVRSSSWPSTPSHRPLDSAVEALLLKLTALLEVEPSSSSASSICSNLIDIKNMYQGINNMILCPLNQRVLSQQQGGMEDVLEGSLALLDASSTINDVMSLMKEAIVELQSCLRRKGGDQSKGFDSYLMSRKKIQKLANRSLKSLNKLNLVNDVSQKNTSIVKLLREAEIVSFSTFRSILAYFSEPTNSKGKSWSLMTKLMNSKQASCDKETRVANEIAKMDESIIGFEAKKTNMDVKMTQELLLKQLKALELSVQEIEGSLEAISRCLLKTRVSLLNVISH